MNLILATCYLLLATSLFIYSYGFVDFNLTLSSHPAVTSFVTWSQQLAMFNRPLSYQIYLGIIFVSFLLYFVTLRHYSKKNLSTTKFPWKIIITIAVIFSVSYPFLSSDVFKYLFAAKELLLYHANPHLIAPQVFEGDTWLRFMRWIHTPSPYGPVMTALAVPYYLIGLGKFVPSLFFFKLDQVFWYLLAIWLIGKLVSKRQVLAQLFFALNPLVLLEWLVNSHNDAPMISLLLLSIYLWKKGRTGWSFLSLLVSIGIKYVTLFFLPFLFFKKIRPSTIVHYSLFILALAPLLYHYQTQFQPWYVTWLVPFAVLSGSVPIMGLIASYSLGALLRYLPFIRIGLWEGSGRYFATLTFAPLLLTLLYFGILWLVNKSSKNQL